MKDTCLPAQHRPPPGLATWMPLPHTVLVLGRSPASYCYFPFFLTDGDHSAVSLLIGSLTFFLAPASHLCLSVHLPQFLNFILHALTELSFLALFSISKTSRLGS